MEENGLLKRKRSSRWQQWGYWGDTSAVDGSNGAMGDIGLVDGSNIDMVENKVQLMAVMGLWDR